jgi:transposase
LRNEYLAAENRILKAQLKTPLRLTDGERVTLAEIAHRLGRKALEDVANAVKPDTLLGWYRKLIARKFDGSQSCRYPGRPGIDHETEQWVVRMAKENSDWGYDRIVGAMANLGYTLSDQTVGNILQRHGIQPAPVRRHTTTWADFIRAHMAVLAGTDFFSVEVLTLRGLVAWQGCQHDQGVPGTFLHRGDFCIQKSNQLLGQEMFLEHLQVAADPELAHPAQ